MNISSTPFIRNDYWPGYNDINQLNQRINEVENELSLTNIRLSTDIENVSNNLNSYANNQANTTIANNIIVNNINANYAVGKFVNFGNANFDNTYIENLTVNKPVFDITLNTPHIENATSLGGNIYDANILNVSITGGNVAFNNVSVDDLNAANATIANLFVNVSSAPVQSSAVLGYDSQGRVIPVEAIYDVGFPENANYLFTDEHGTAFAGVAATEVSAVDNLITAQAVQNSYNDINNTFNDVNNFINGSFNDVNNTFNDVNNFINESYNDVNNFVNDCYNDINNTFNDVDNTVNDIDILLKALISLSTCDAKYYTINSGSTNNVGLDNTFTYIAFTTPADTTGHNVSLDNKNPVYAKVVGDTLTYSSDFIITNDFMGRVFNSNMTLTFLGCTSLNQNILIPNSVVDMTKTFYGCTSLNQNILIPNSVNNMSWTFWGCTSLNQNMLIPNSVVDMSWTFYGCNSLNQNILIPNSVNNMTKTFNVCTSLNQNILIPNSVVDMSWTFNGCTSLNQNILIPNSVNNMTRVFSGCTSLNQNIYIYSENITNIRNTFNYCTLLTDKYIHIRNSIPMDTSNDIYNSLVNGYTGIDWTGRVVNDLEEPTQWPPV